MSKRAQPSQNPGSSAGTTIRLNIGAVASVGKPRAGHTVNQPIQAAIPASPPNARPTAP